MKSDPIMKTRREFLIYGAGAVGVGAIATNDLVARTMTSAELILVDKSIPQRSWISAQLFGVDAAFTEYSGDPIDIWSDFVRPALQNSTAKVAGITSGQDAFALTEMARDFGVGLLSCQPLDGDRTTSHAIDALSLSNSDYFVWTLGAKGVKFR